MYSHDGDYRMALRERVEDARTRPAYWVQRLNLQLTSALHQAMQSQGMSRRDFAERLGAHASWVSRLMGCQENVTLRTIARLALACGLEPELRFTKGAAQRPRRQWRDEDGR